MKIQSKVKDIQDIWIRYLKYPWSKNIIVGHMKEPFSLDYLASISRITFMERLYDAATNLHLFISACVLRSGAC